MTSPYYPAFLDLRGRRCLVVGGGSVAERKVHALREAGARVCVVAPRLTPGLAALAARREIVHWPRRFRPGDVAGAMLVVCATGLAGVDAAAAAAARRQRALVNAVDRRALCDLIVPAVVRRGHLQIAVSTGGRCPALAREIRRRLEALFPDDCADLLEEVGRARRVARRRARTPVMRLAAGERVARSALGQRLMSRLADVGRP